MEFKFAFNEHRHSVVLMDQMYSYGDQGDAMNTKNASV